MISLLKILKSRTLFSECLTPRSDRLLQVTISGQPICIVCYFNTQLITKFYFLSLGREAIFLYESHLKKSMNLIMNCRLDNNRPQKAWGGGGLLFFITSALIMYF